MPHPRLRPVVGSLRLQAVLAGALALAATACAPVLAQTAPTASIAYAPIEAYQGGDCGETDHPVCRVRRPWSVDTLRARVGSESAVWSSGADEITFAYRGAATAVGSCCSIQMPLSPVAGTDLWVLTTRVPDADRLAMTAAFIVEDSTAGTREMTDRADWSGPDASPPPPRVEQLAGTLRTDSLRSSALGTMRAITVYVPPSWSGQPRRVIYLADGQSTEDYARVLEAAALAGQAPPVALVGLHHTAADREPGSPFGGRTREYLVGVDSVRYANHERFFLEEVIPWTERTLGVSSAPADRAVFGTSNGASFATAMVRRHPEQFLASLAFSHAHDGVEPDESLDLSRHRFAFVAGRLEPGFLERQRAAAGEVALRGADVRQVVGVSGHDAAMWIRAFVDAVAWAFAALE